MQELTTQIKDSGARLKETGASLFTTTYEATGAFVGATKQAYTTLIKALAEAGVELKTETGAAGAEFVGTLTGEAEAWRTFLVARAPRLELAAPKKIEFESINLELDVPSAEEFSARLKAAPKNVEEQVLRAMQNVIDQVGGHVNTRLEGIDNKAPVAKLPAAKKVRPTKAAAKKVTAPLRGYDSLTAREIATKVSRATPAKVEAIGAYERSNKGRTTVLRAVEARLA